MISVHGSTMSPKKSTSREDLAVIGLQNPDRTQKEKRNRLQTHQLVIKKLEEIEDLKDALYQERFNTSIAKDESIKNIRNMLNTMKKLEEEVRKLRMEQYKYFESSLDLDNIGLMFPIMSPEGARSALPETRPPSTGPKGIGMPKPRRRSVGPDNRASSDVGASSPRQDNSSSAPVFGGDTGTVSTSLLYLNLTGNSDGSNNNNMPAGRPPKYSTINSYYSEDEQDDYGSSDEMRGILTDRPASAASTTMLSSSSSKYGAKTDRGNYGRDGQHNKAMQKWTSTLNVVQSGLQWKRFWQHKKQVTEAESILNSGEAKMTKAQILQLRGTLYSLREKKNLSTEEARLKSQLERKLKTLEEKYKKDLERDLKGEDDYYDS
eukprot:GEZU01003114.1.p1 GENE.GEZU01003114.1~~GEZU01003114.1.p1  ORF type:complete len:377 (-),score=104.25 GEZU01003114.1:189-1319(-)